MERNNLYTVKGSKGSKFVDILRTNCFLKQVIEGKIERKRRGRRRKQLMDDLKEKRGY